MKKIILLMLIAASFMSVSKGNISFDKQKKMEEEIVLQTKEKEQEKENKMKRREHVKRPLKYQRGTREERMNRTE